jgi:hypothetical protein
MQKLVLNFKYTQEGDENNPIHNYMMRDNIWMQKRVFFIVYNF